jgi:molybdopterin synthase sulfur carrier subunit
MRILYFAQVREAIGKDEEELRVPAEVTSVGGLVDWLSTLSEAHRVALADRARLRAAVNQQFVQLDAPLAGAYEVALFPPVTGG